MIASMGRYQLQERIAAGGMGEVFRGVDVGWGGVERPVAVKIISPTLSHFPDFVSTFIDEARLSYLLCHANVVQVRDIGQFENTYFIAMEWVNGTDLGSLLGRLGLPLPVRFATLLAAEAARGLDYAHRICGSDGKPLGLVHRDVSPPNILLSWEGEVKVTDFGIARWRNRETQSLPGSLKGKIGYMAPEQARSEEVDLRTDVFALGVMLYEMVVGKHPFTAGASDQEVLTRVRTCAFSPPSTLGPLSSGLEAIIMRAMSALPADRYPSCAALREEAFARREAVSWSPPKLGAFVRRVMETEVDPALARTDRMARPVLPRAETPVTMNGRVRPASNPLAPLETQDLQGFEGDDNESTTPRLTAPPTEAPPTPPVPAWVSAAVGIESPTGRGRRLARRGEGGDELDAVPRSRTALWAVLTGLLGVGIGSAIFFRREPPAPVAVIQPDRVSTKASLTVSSAVGSKVFIDELLIGPAPVELELSAGTHLVRVEAGVSSRAETIVLREGERRHVLISLRDN